MTIQGRLWWVAILAGFTAAEGCSSSGAGADGPKDQAVASTDRASDDTGTADVALSEHQATPDTSGDAPPDLPARFAAAAASWVGAKSACGTYSYSRHWSSLVGSHSDTTVQIEGDVATRRHLFLYLYDPTKGADAATSTEQDENGMNVGKTQLPAGSPMVFPAETVEQLFAECGRVLEPQTEDHIFIVNDLGVPTKCGSIPKNCVGDCSSQIDLRAFACAPLGIDGQVPPVVGDGGID